jgi:hypothetical protein
MQHYIGTKVIKAEPCTAERAAEILGREIETKDADSDGNGYLVEYEGGYRSWSPSEPFEKAYRKTDGMTFGLAIEALKAGKKVARVGWNRKGMYIVMTPGSTIDSVNARSGAAKALADEGKKSIEILPHIDMRTADGKVFVGWTPNQIDQNSEDWMIVD